VWTRIFRRGRKKTDSPGGEETNSASMPVVKTVGGQAEAAVLKGRLEAEDIPVHLSYDSAGAVYGFSSTHLGRVDIMVPKAFESAARFICGTETDTGPASTDPPPDPGGNEAA